MKDVFDIYIPGACTHMSAACECENCENVKSERKINLKIIIYNNITDIKKNIYTPRPTRLALSKYTLHPTMPTPPT